MEGQSTTAVPARIEAWASMSQWERSELGRELRRLGLSYGEIQALVPVKASTLATWCREVVLSNGQAEEIVARTGSRRGVPRDTQWRRRLAVNAIRSEAAISAGDLAGESLWVAGTAIYWAEGAKTAPRLGLANSDPRVSRLFIRWVRTYHDPGAEFVLKLNLHAENDEPAARSWWATELNLTGACFYKTFIKPTGTGHRRNHLAHGICDVRVRRSADAWHRSMEWIDALARLGESADC